MQMQQFKSEVGPTQRDPESNMRFHPARLVLIAACILLPACAAQQTTPELSTSQAQVEAEIEFDRLSWKYEGTPDIFLLNTCYDLYGFLEEGFIDFVGILECYREQVADKEPTPEDTGPRDLSPKAQ